MMVNILTLGAAEHLGKSRQETMSAWKLSFVASMFSRQVASQECLGT
jgi:hypothetical protein